jgi:hypothetical protein
LNIEVRYDDFEKADYKIKSNFCRLKENKLLIVDKSLILKDKIDILIKELSQFNLEHIYIPPKIRELITPKKKDSNK